MKLEIKESYEGELEEHAQKVRDKAAWALQTALKAAGVSSCCGGLEKSLTSENKDRIGEVQVIEDLTQMFSALYEERLRKLKSDIVEKIEDLNE